MRSFLILFLSCVCITSCKQDQAKMAAGNHSYEDEIQFLKSENLRKDTMITQSIAYFNEIERNLANIEMQEKQIRDAFVTYGQKHTGNKETLLEKIKLMNSLRIENARKLSLLQQKLDTLNVAQKEFKELFTRLQFEIKQKDKTIAMLQKILAQKDKKYSELFEEYQKQVDINLQQEVVYKEITSTVNTVYYAIGTQKELKANNVINVKKKLLTSNEFDIKSKFNEAYFTAVKINEFQDVVVDSKSIRLVGSHPENSYEIVKEGNNKVRLRILDSQNFWKVSRYLIIVTN